MGGEVVQIVGHIIEAMRGEFNTKANKPLGGLTGEIAHRGGLLVPIDGFPEGGSTDVDCNVSLAFVNVLRRYRTTTFPSEQGEVAPCGGQRATLIQVGVARCAMTIDDYGNPPPPERLEREALVLLDDADRLDRALCRANRSMDDDDLIDASIIHAWEPLGPEGGILTGLQTASYLIA